MRIMTSIWALVLIFGPCFVYSQITVTTDSGTIQTITENEEERNTMRVDSGASIELVCTIPDDEVLQTEQMAIWQGPRSVLYFGETAAHKNPKLSIRKNRVGSATEWILGMEELTIDEEGDYQCQDLNENGYMLWLYVSTAPTIFSISPMQKAAPGDEVKMRCEATGSPVPKIKWRHTRPNTKLPNGIEGQYKKGINLDIDSITLDDRGEYECIASNGIPNDRFKPSKTTYIQMEYEPVVKALTKDNPELKVPMGESAELRCKAEGFPRVSSSDVAWYLEDEAISDVDGFSVEVVHEVPDETPDKYNETTYSILRIVEVNSNNTGDYKCQFRNTRGHNSAIIMLQIGERPVYIAADPDGNNPRDNAAALSTSLVTILSMLFLIITLFH